MNPPKFPHIVVKRKHNTPNHRRNSNDFQIKTDSLKLKANHECKAQSSNAAASGNEAKQSRRQHQQPQIELKCWMFVMGKLQYPTPLPNKLWDLFQSWPELYSNSFFSHLWICIPAIIVWAIWWERNKRIFQQSPSTIETVLTTIEKSISEVVNSNHSIHKCNPVLSQWDTNTLRQWKHLTIPTGSNLEVNTSSTTNRDNVHRIPPTSNFVKLNFDGSSMGNPGSLGVGACIRDHYGKVLPIKADPLPPGTNNFAEAYALFIGLVLAKQRGYCFIQVEGDSMVIILACIQRVSHNWRLTYILTQIWQLHDSFEEVLISHTLREGNTLADFLANMGCDGCTVSELEPTHVINNNGNLQKVIVEDIKFCRHQE